MRKIVITFMLIVGIIGLVACSSGGSEVVVKSKAGDITKDDFYEELKDLAGEDVLRNMITMKVLEDQFEVSDKDVEKQIETLKEQLGEEQFQMALMRQGVSDADSDEFKEIMRNNLLFQEAAYGDIEVTEEDAKEHYERLKTEIEAHHILVTDEDEAKDIKEKLDNGEDFAELAKEFSIDGSAEKGGELGYFTAGNMVKPFEDAAYNMEVDTISDLVQSDFGFHIIKVTDKRDAETELGSFEDMKEDIILRLKMTELSEEEANQKIDQIIEDADFDIKIEDYEDLFKVEG